MSVKAKLNEHKAAVVTRVLTEERRALYATGKVRGAEAITEFLETAGEASLVRLHDILKGLANA